jgi:mono/diheme cytochrome c family protein
VIRRTLFFLLFFFGWGQSEDFITEFEYGQMLYHNPRGASCATCHGETGAGELIAEYTDRQGQYVALNGPDIRRATLDQLRRSIHKGAGVMPRYFLTENEIQTIHAYLQMVNKRTETGISDLFTKTEENQTVK